MAQAVTLARPYARAAFEVAQDAGTQDAWSQALAFAAVIAADPQVAALAGDPRVTDAQLVALHLPSGMAADAPFAQFLDEMAEQRRLALLPEVAALYAAFRRES
jgi:F-type H+-transporting ATPase subunit delta